MGDHLCTEADAEEGMLGRAGIMGGEGARHTNSACPVPPLPPSKSSQSYGSSLSDKYDRMPPSLDTNAASKSPVPRHLPPELPVRRPG